MSPGVHPRRVSGWEQVRMARQSERFCWVFGDSRSCALWSSSSDALHSHQRLAELDLTQCHLLPHCPSILSLHCVTAEKLASGRTIWGETERGLIPCLEDSLGKIRSSEGSRHPLPNVCSGKFSSKCGPEFGPKFGPEWSLDILSTLTLVSWADWWGT